MLSTEFIDWWFAPWRYAIETVSTTVDDNVVSQRDGYRNWCTEAGIASDYQRNLIRTGAARHSTTHTCWNKLRAFSWA